jgi:uncharacterized iron-regulated membrane protein
MRFRQFIQSLHRWLGLALAIQIVIWMSSGVVMSLLPIEHVRGENMVAYHAPTDLKVQNYFPPAGVLAEVGGAREATLKSWLGREVYVVTGANGKAMFDADTGDRLSPISEADARRAALADFAGEDGIDRAILLNSPPRESGRDVPLWRVEFTDENQTRLYISPETGDVVARRNRVWRFYDFFWMLHIMDYKDRDNFNNPLIRTFAITGLMFALSGLALVIFRIESGRYVEDGRRAIKRRNSENEKAAD